MEGGGTAMVSPHPRSAVLYPREFSCASMMHHGLETISIFGVSEDSDLVLRRIDFCLQDGSVSGFSKGIRLRETSLQILPKSLQSPKIHLLNDSAKKGYKACLEVIVRILPSFKAPVGPQEVHSVLKRGWDRRAIKKAC